MMMMRRKERRIDSFYILVIRYIAYLNVCLFQLVLCDLFCANARMIENVPLLRLSFVFLLS